MAAQRDPPWNNYEKNTLLCEIIKAWNPQPNILMSFIASNHMQPNWNDTPLPQGRSLSSCRIAYNEMQRGTSSALLTGPTAPPLQPASPMTAPMTFGKLPHTAESVQFSGREIRPKPSPSSTSTTYPPQSLVEQPRKKRGRPTKAEQRARAEAQRAAMQTQAPRSRLGGSAPSLQTHTLSPRGDRASYSSQGTWEGTRSSLPSASRMNISSMLSQVPPESTPTSATSPSSGRKRARSIRSEPDDFLERRRAVASEAVQFSYERTASEPHNPPASPRTLPPSSPWASYMGGGERPRQMTNQPPPEEPSPRRIPPASPSPQPTSHGAPAPPTTGT